MELAADHTISSGPWKGGKWTYNDASQILTANGVTLYLYRETDWGAVTLWRNQQKSAYPPASAVE